MRLGGAGEGPDVQTGVGRLTRRDVLRLVGASAVATALPVGLSSCMPTTTPGPLAPDASLRSLGFVGGTDVDLGPGAWCWFQSPRSSMGPNGVLWLGTSVGVGSTAKGAVQVTAYDTRANRVLTRRTVENAQVDDHTSPSVMTFGDRVQVAWARHWWTDYLDIGETSVTGPFTVQRIQRPAAKDPPGIGTSYCSAHVVDGVRWVLYRGEQFSWNLLTSPDGVTWTPRGLVIQPRTPGDRPYFQAASDGRRLWFVVTDAHPSDFGGCGAYAGSIDPDLRIFRSDGVEAGRVGSAPPLPRSLTHLAEGVDGPGEAGDVDHWLSDLRTIGNRPCGVLIRRDPWPAGSASVGNYRHAYLWIRQRGSSWVVEPLCWAGGELTPTQPDYAGLATQDPTDASRVVVSTDVDPVTGDPLVSRADGLVHHELFEAQRQDDGTWSFSAITVDSTAENVRPHIAAGGTAKTLSWMRGSYRTWEDFETRIIVRRAVPMPAHRASPSTATSAGSASAAFARPS